MKRIALLLGAVAAALAFAGSALAAFSPKLVITHDPLTPQGGGKTDIAVSFDQNDDATFRAVIYAAVGYTRQSERKSGLTRRRKQPPTK